HQRRLAGTVEHGLDGDGRGRWPAALVEMHDAADALGETNEPQPPAPALTKEQFLRMMQRRLADKLAFAAHQGPFQLFRQAAHAGLARRILDRAPSRGTPPVPTP